jgi:hypothetical protein
MDAYSPIIRGGKPPFLSLAPLDEPATSSIANAPEAVGAGAPRGVRLFTAGAPLEAAREHPPSKDDVSQIVPREIGELVPGIVAHELKSLRQELKKTSRASTAASKRLRRSTRTCGGKEIDGIRAEVRAIQKLLVEKKIAA